jgi:hypothetical protein
MKEVTGREEAVLPSGKVGGRPLQATGVHERVMELLTAVGTPKIHGTLHPRKIVERVKLGESLAAGEAPRLGVSTKDVRDAFFGFLEPPRISSASVLRKAISRGVAEGLFAYTTGMPTLGADGSYQVLVSKIARNRAMAEDEIDLDGGFLMVASAVPVEATPPPGLCPTCGKSPCQCTTPPAVCPNCGTSPCECQTPPLVCPKCGKAACVCPKVRTSIRIAFPASRDDVFKSFPAIANLADKSDGAQIKITVEGQCGAGYDPNWLRNAVQEPLDEANIDGLEIQ